MYMYMQFLTVSLYPIQLKYFSRGGRHAATRHAHTHLEELLADVALLADARQLILQLHHLLSVHVSQLLGLPQLVVERLREQKTVIGDTSETAGTDNKTTAGSPATSGTEHSNRVSR